ncbi:3-oxoacyl-ACP reductase FabG [Nocardioides carbamazepini]|uniref:SDR family NAD(P)-dependent oxidoreductase n=1 Tax=Nocardioides carbamazepini TaxID=2854259 RepID=UPI002149C691|nr:3-oxoacyl-ACP reductase FabG [Nocardioides carbamazepini]MCR1786192.1 3-oxoacyl-ACP reductase FabG [Nocardioides carbamazepini]
MSETSTAEPRVVVITGGSRGLGAGIVQAYLDEGDVVATCARSSTPEVEKWQGDAAVADRFLFLPADVSSSADCAAFVNAVIERFGRIDVLINNAGVARDGVIGLTSDEDIDVVVDLNIKGSLYMARQVSRRMMVRRSGTIVNISSVVGRSGYRGLAVYSATKAALEGMTRALARELGTRGITVNAIAPGYLRTEMSHGLDEEQLQQIVRRTPAGRLGDPEDIARACQFLTDPRNTYLTGQVLVVDGGLTG